MYERSLEAGELTAEQNREIAARVVRSYAFKCGSTGDEWGETATVEFDMTGGCERVHQCEIGDRDRQTTATATERLSYREDGNVLESVEALVETGAYPNRSEAIRDMIRQLVSEETRDT